MVFSASGSGHKVLAGLIAAVTLFQAVAAAAAAAPAAAGASAQPTEPFAPPAPLPLAPPDAVPLPARASAAPAGLATAPSGALPGGTVVAAGSPAEVVQQLSAKARPPGSEDIAQEAHNYGAGAPLSITPLTDTDNNDINMARWLNGSSSHTGESINGKAMGNGVVDIDFWKFPLVNHTLSSSDVIEFDIAKEAGEHMFAQVWAWPSFDPANYGQLTQAHVVLYDYINSSQGWGVNSHIKVTGFEDALYILYLSSPRRMTCLVSQCSVNYTITNITQYTVTGDSTIDDNSNRTTADVFNPSAMPTNEEVEQNSDYVDVFDLSAQFAITPSAGDYSQVTVSATINAGRTGLSDYWDFTKNPDVGAKADTLSYATLWLIYADPRGLWHVYTSSGVPNQTLSVTQLVNGTPVYAAVSVYSFVNDGAIDPYSDVPGWVRYSFTTFTHQDDLAPRLATAIPASSMYEDNATSGANLYDLSLYFTDDRDQGALYFTLKYNQFPNNVTATFSGKWISLTTSPDWWGNVTLQVLAHDLGMDRVVSPADDHSTSSNFFIVNVQPTNDPPSIDAVGGLANLGGTLAFNVSQGATLVLTPTVSDRDGNAGDTFSLAPVPGFATFTPSNGTTLFAPANGDVGPHNMTLSVTDFGGATASVLLLVNVLNVNDNPWFVRVGGFNVSSLPSSFAARQGQAFTLTLQVEDPDWEIGIHDPLSFAADKTFINANLTQDPTDLRNATTHFTPTNAQVGTLSVRFSVSDGARGDFDDNVTVSIVVVNANDPPVIVSVCTLFCFYPSGSPKEVDITGLDGATQGREFSMTLRADDPDIAAQLGDSLTFSTDLGAKVRVTPADATSATLAFTPNQSDATRGHLTVLVTVRDAGSPPFEDSITVVIDVANVNDPPALTPVFSLNLTQGEEFIYTFAAVDPDGDAVTFSSDKPIFPIDPSTGVVDFTPTNDLIDGANLIFDVTVGATDGHLTSSIVVHVQIANVNDRPSGVRIDAPSQGQAFAPGDSVTFSGAGTDIDKGDAALLTFSWYADGEKIGEGRNLGHAFANPSESDKTVAITLTVSDPHGASTNATTSITVHGTAKPASPGFEAPLVLAALLAAFGGAALARRRRA